jgi:hypothetical protein
VPPFGKDKADFRPSELELFAEIRPSTLNQTKLCLRSLQNSCNFNLKSSSTIVASPTDRESPLFPAYAPLGPCFELSADGKPKRLIVKRFLNVAFTGQWVLNRKAWYV